MSRNRLETIHCIPNTNIMIDSWKPTKEKYFRFMSLNRLDSHQVEYIKSDTYKIYTSREYEFHLTKVLKIPEERIVGLVENQTISIEEDEKSFKVTRLDANYCIGSSMFLFQGSFGNILFTGYFRPAIDMDPLEVPVLKNLIRNNSIDIVFIDNTYASDSCIFPSRAQSIRQLITLIRDHPEHKVVISKSSFGKEEVLVKISQALGEKLCVAKEKYNFYCMMKAEDFFTANGKGSRITVIDHILRLRECKEWQTKEGKCLIIFLTAMYMSQQNASERHEITRLPGVHIIPYSGHCSHEDLMEFLSILKPRRIEPIIIDKKSTNYIIPQSLLDLCYEPPETTPILDSDFYFNTYTEEDTMSQTACKNVSNAQSTALETTHSEKGGKKDRAAPGIIEAKAAEESDDSNDVFYDGLQELFNDESDDAVESSSFAGEQSLQTIPDTAGDECLQGFPNITADESLQEIPDTAADIRLQEIPDITTDDSLQAIPDTAADESLLAIPDTAANKSLLAIPDTAADESLSEIPDTAADESLPEIPDTVVDVGLQMVPETTDSGRSTSTENCDAESIQTSSRENHTAFLVQSNNQGVYEGSGRDDEFSASGNGARSLGDKVGVEKSCQNEKSDENAKAAVAAITKMVVENRDTYDDLICSDLIIDSEGPIGRHTQQMSCNLESEQSHSPKRKKLSSKEEQRMHSVLHFYTFMANPEHWPLKIDQWDHLTGLKFH